MARARHFFEQAIALDPDNVEALVGLAWVDGAAGITVMADDWAERFAKAEVTITKALSHAPNHAIAHLILSLVQMYTGRAAQAIAECEQALALEPNLAPAHALIGYTKSLLGRSEETEAHVNEALRLSPRDPFAYQWMVWVGFANANLGRDAEAVVWLRRGLDANRNYSNAHFHLASALARLGKLDEARTSVKAGLALDPAFTIRRLRAATRGRSDNPPYLAGRERIFEGMRTAGVPEG